MTLREVNLITRSKHNNSARNLRLQLALQCSWTDHIVLYVLEDGALLAPTMLNLIL